MRWISGLMLAVALCTQLAAVEPWADGELKVTDGLELWLDAAVQDAARSARWLGTLHAMGPVGVLYDASGRGRHVSQSVREARPRFMRLGDQAAVRFDGQDDFLAGGAPRSDFKEMTVFILAAPRSNPGGFRAMLAVAQDQRNDFQTGLNIDLGPYPSPSLSVLNAEGAGFIGAQNLVTSGGALGQFQVFCITIRADGLATHLDGRPQATRKRESAPIRLDHLILGARIFGHGAEAPFIQGFFEGDISQVLIYGRALPASERKQVEQYLLRKRNALQAAAAEFDSGFLLSPVKDSPPVQVLVPGFTVRQLPLDLTNINNLRYRPDGKLVALGYNGDVWLLTDSDGDGLEDQPALFWDNKGRIQQPIGMALTPPGYAYGQGLFVAGKGKLSLIVDTDGDDVADKEIIVAEGWPSTTHGVDALGVALDKDGSIYFGIGTTSFPAPYLIDKEGTARYSLSDERGTILKVAPDFSSREIVCTGIRFPVGLAFNSAGDLFATDQEGATWVPNGNPLDELLHIQPGRHYGFPARHPKHLPGVIDEPSVFDYGPQHQSTCGLTFNDGVNGGPVFGPAWWGGDAIIAGESRGKIFRTKLVKTTAGYVAQNNIIACLDMLTIDACVSPAGDLVVSCHSGPPDWGTGPHGKGKLYKITYSDRSHPQPVLAWAAGPTEVRIAFDRPIDPARLTDVSRNVSITYGYGVRAGDPFEKLRPPYALVEQQLATPRFHLAVNAVSVSPDRRTLILTTAPHPRDAEYAITLAGSLRDPRLTSDGALPQHPQIDLDYALTGVEAVWAGSDGQVLWSGWLPHMDLAVSRNLLAASSEHERLWELLRRPGRLVMRTRIDVKDMLRPAVQPGSSVDFTYPEPERVTLSFESTGDVQILEPRGSGDRRLELAGEAPVAVEIALATGSADTHLSIAYRTNEDNRPRALPLRRLVAPWAPDKTASTKPVARHIPQIEGGDWLSGRELFFSDQALCSRCHSVAGRGSHIGPDLTNLTHRDYASVLRDIQDPSAAINPDHIAYSFSLRDGRTLVGVPRTLPDGGISIGDVAGHETIIGESDIASRQPLPISLMPAKLDEVLGPQGLKDLMTFLLTEPLEPAKIDIPNAPPPRSRREVEALLAGSLRDPGPSAHSDKELHIVLVAGTKDHGPGEHDYPLWKQRWSKLLALAENVKVETADEWPSQPQLEKADVIVFYQFGNWDSQRAAAVDAVLARGGGLVYLHWAVAGREQQRAREFAERIGLAAGLIKFRHGPLELSFTDHPITSGLTTAQFHDESYWHLAGDLQSINVLATGVEEGEPRPLMWTRQVGPGRVFVSIPGHFNWTFDDPIFRVLVLRGIAWAAGEPTQRLTHLATVGARLAD